MRTQFKANARLCMAVSLLLVSLIGGGCGGGSGGSGKTGVSPLAGSSVGASATRGQGKVAFTIHWPTATGGRLVPLAAKALKFTVVESEAPNNVVVLTKIAPRPADSETTSTVLLDGLPTVLVTIKAEAYPNADATGVVQASGTVTVQVNGNQTTEKTVTLDTTVKTVEVTAAAPVTIGADGKFQLNLSDSTSGDSVKAALTATAYNAAHEIVLTALDKWVYKSAKPDVAKVEATGGTRAEGITGAMATVTATGAGNSAITVTESESQVSKELTASVIGSRPSFWNQAFGDAQNSSCSSGPSASGTVVSSFTPAAEGAGTLNEPYAYQSVEDMGGNLAFYANASSDTARGIYVYSKSGTKQSHLGGGDGAPGGPTYGADGTLYTIEYSNGITSGAHVVARGAKSWNFAGNGPILSFLTLSGDNATLYVDVAGNLTALNAATGQKLWQVPTGTTGGATNQYAFKPAVSLDNATVYAKTSAGVAAFDAVTGSKRWENAASSPASASLGYVGVGPTGTVYADNIQSLFASNTSFRAIDPATGRTLWSQDKFGGNYVLSRNGTVYGTIGFSKVQALSGTTGAILWTIGNGLDDSGHGTLYITQAGAGDGTVYVSKLDALSSYYGVRSIAALNAADGSAKWVLAPNIYSHPVDGVTATSGSYTVEFVGGDGTVYGLNPAANALGTPRTLDAIR